MRQALLLLAVMLVGCRQAAPLVSPRPVTPQVPQAQAIAKHDAPIAKEPTAPAPVPAPAETDAIDWTPFQAIADQGGVVQDLEGFGADDAGYTTAIVPESTQTRAESFARAWAADARQVYIGWGFWKTSLLGQTRHLYYSKTKNKALRMEFKLLKGRCEMAELPGDGYKSAFWVLNEAHDDHAYQAKDAYRVARDHGYRPRKHTIAVLLDIKLFGPTWCFLDGGWDPLVLVDADSGEVSDGGPRMWAARYLIGRSGPGGIPVETVPCRH